MYVKIRRDGALGIGRATEGEAEITIGYGEAHMIAAALEKLAQTARNYKQVYLKTTDVGGGNKILFERSEDGTIKIAGDRQEYFLTEEEVRELAHLLKHLPPVEVAPASDYVQKITPENGHCLVVKNGPKNATLRITEAALLRIAIMSSVNSRFYEEHLTIDGRSITVVRSSDLKWAITVNGDEIRFTAYEIEALLAGLYNGILDVLMDLVKSLGSDEIADIRVKSKVQHIEQETTKIMQDHRQAKTVIKTLSKFAQKIIGGKADADERTKSFIEMCRFIQAKIDRQFVDPLFNLISQAFVYVP